MWRGAARLRTTEATKFALGFVGAKETPNGVSVGFRVLGFPSHFATTNDDCLISCASNNNCFHCLLGGETRARLLVV